MYLYKFDAVLSNITVGIVNSDIRAYLPPRTAWISIGNFNRYNSYTTSDVGISVVA